MPYRVGYRVYRYRRLCRLPIRVYAYLAKIVPETRLEIGSGGCVQRLPRRAQHLVHRGRCPIGGLGFPRMPPLKLFTTLPGICLTAQAPELAPETCQG